MFPVLTCAQIVALTMLARCLARASFRLRASVAACLVLSCARVAACAMLTCTRFAARATRARFAALWMLARIHRQIETQAYNCLSQTVSYFGSICG